MDMKKYDLLTDDVFAALQVLFERKDKAKIPKRICQLISP
jgi:hypothetical protein